MFGHGHEEKEEEYILCAIARQLTRIADVLERVFSVRDFQLHQIIYGEYSMAITGIVVGSAGNFQETPVPSTNFVPLQSGPTFTSDLADAVVSADPGGDVTKCVVTVAATSAATSFNLTVAGVNGKGDAISHSFNIPILPLPPPLPSQITDFSLNQL